MQKSKEMGFPALEAGGEVPALSLIQEGTI
jgi:hypothetical protein